jgi:tetratricopeptide (TPR) repeat protein
MENFKYSAKMTSSGAKRRHWILLSLILASSLSLPSAWAENATEVGTTCGAKEVKTRTLKAIVAYQKLLDVVPQDKEARKNLARYLAANGNIDQAMKEYQRAAHSSSFELEVKSRLLALRLEQDVHDPASVNFEDSDDDLPGNIHYQLAAELLTHGMELAALNEFCLSVTSTQPELQGWREIGTLLSASGNYYLASNALTRYSAMVPDALDAISVYNKATKIKQYHEPEILQSIADLQNSDDECKIALGFTAKLSSQQ